LIAVPAGVRNHMALGATDMRCSFDGLALLVQETLRFDPFICVGCNYVAASPGNPSLCGYGQAWPPHNIFCTFSAGPGCSCHARSGQGATLEFYFRYLRVLRRLRGGGLGDEMDRIAAYLAEFGYKRASAKVYLSQLGRFSGSVPPRATRTMPIDQAVIDRFVDDYSSETPRIAARTAIDLARRVAPERFSAPPVAADPHAPLLAAYLDHLQRVRGLEPKTCEGQYDAHVPGQPIAAMTGEHVLAVVEHLLALSCNDYTRASTTSYIRAFLRFLRWSDLNGQDLACFVPRTPCYRLAHLPPRLAWDDVRRAIDAISAATPTGVRNRAILLLLATTGLRNKELRSLELRDIRWREAAVLVRRTKARRDRVVPLLQETGAALAEYVLHAAWFRVGLQVKPGWRWQDG